MKSRTFPILGVLCAAFLAAAISGWSLAPSAAAATKKATGGTVTIAMAEGQPINYIFPFMSSEYLGGVAPDIYNFQYLMYRPLYWWDGSPYELSKSRSLAKPPTFEDHDKTVVIQLKSGWKFSDGQTIGPENVAFFIGMVVSEYANFWSYIPGDFPDNLASASYDNAKDTVTLHLTESVNPTWFLENQLTMITPFPSAWDLSAPGKKSHCESETVKVEKADCPAVYKYLASQAGDTATYATNPLWQVVDGPFHLTQYAQGGTSVTFEPNRHYSGSPKARIKLVEDVPTSTAAEYGLLQSGALTIGYVPFSSAPIKPITSSKAPTNPVPSYDLQSASPTWSYNDMFWNYNNPKIGPLLHQLYFRQAMQSLVDQKADIETALRGYGHVDYGPNPPQPANVFETSYEKSDPYPYSPSKARKYLTENGWKIPSSGAAYCVRPGADKGECGSGISRDEKIPTITLQYTSGNQAFTLEVSNLQSAAAGVGIEITPVAEASSELASQFPGCTPSQAECKWQMMYLGTPEVDSEVPYPASTVVFDKGATFNVSNYVNAYVTSLFHQVITKPGNGALDTLDDYLTRSAALLWMPVSDDFLYEVSPHLEGFTESPVFAYQPETWHFSK